MTRRSSCKTCAGSAVKVVMYMTRLAAAAGLVALVLLLSAIVNFWGLLFWLLVWSIGQG